MVVCIRVELMYVCINVREKMVLERYTCTSSLGHTFNHDVPVCVSSKCVCKSNVSCWCLMIMVSRYVVQRNNSERSKVPCVIVFV